MFPTSTSLTEAPQAKPDNTPAGGADDASDAVSESKVVVQAAAESAGVAVSASAPAAGSQPAKSAAQRRKSAPAARARSAQAAKKAATGSPSATPAAAAVAAPTPPASEQPQAPEPAPKGKKRNKKSAASDKAAVPSKMVRDSFTMPEADFALLSQMKRRAIAAQRETKKSELLRAGLQVLAQLSDADLIVALNALTPVKAGRPKKR